MPSSRVDQVRPTFEIGWHGYALILLFWTFFGVLVSCTLFLSPLPASGEAEPQALVGFAFLGAYTWAALTPALFSLTGRLDLTNEEASWRVLRVVGLLVFGLALSIAVAVGVSFVVSVALGDFLGGRLAGPEGPWAMTRYSLTHDILACHLILAAGVGRDYFLRYRSRLSEAALLRTELAEARLLMLRAQLNPHFLFNTLNAVAALVQTDPRGVRRMIALLSDLLRETLDGTSELEVPLSRELDTLSRYVDIMAIRFGGRLDTRVVAAADTVDALVPQLILQPLVENALKHGVERAVSTTIEVKVARRDDELLLSVYDGDMSRAESFVHEVQNGALRPGREGGFGLRHVRERLSHLYGDRAVLELRSIPGGGTAAEIRLPFRTDITVRDTHPSLNPRGLESIWEGVERP